MSYNKNQKPSKTELVIEEMLKENTGTHMLDSGCVYGRNYERNKNKNFSSELEGTVRFTDYGIDISLSLYHYLNRILVFEPKLNKEFERFCSIEENRNKSWFECLDFWLKSINASGPEDSNPITDNSCNWDTNLSQVFQATVFYLPNKNKNQSDSFGPYVALSIHGGCDVRGGYTRPRIFTQDDWTDIFSNVNGKLWCEKNHMWDFDQCGDGYDIETDLEIMWLNKYPRISKDLFNEIKESVLLELKESLRSNDLVDRLASMIKEKTSAKKYAIGPEDKDNILLARASIMYAEITKTFPKVLVYDTVTEAGYCPECGTKLSVSL